MGRHTRDDEPVPHPQDRAAGRSHPGEARRGDATGAHPVANQGPAPAKTPKRSSISAAFGIAGRNTPRGESSGYFVSGGGEASGSYPVAGRGDATASQPTARRGEASGSYPVAGRGEATGAQPTARRGEASGSYPVAGRGETTGAQPAARRGEATGAQPTARRGEASGSYPVAGRGETTGAQPTARRGEVSGSYPVAGRDDATGAQPTTRRGEASGAFPATRRRGESSVRRDESAAERTEVITRHGEASGNYPITARAENTGSHRTLERPEATAGGESTPRRRRRDDAGETATRRTPRRGETTGPHRTDAKTDGKSEATGSHRIAPKSEATGSHRIVGKKAPRRRIAGWPIACAVLAALIGLGVIGWNWADSELNNRAEAQAASCSGGTSQMRIVVTPSVQKPMTAAAERWNQAATVVHGQCVHVTIDAKPSSQVLDALVGRANLDAIGGLPAAWLPESSYWVSELTQKKPEMIGSPAQSVASARSADYPFIGLTGQGIDDTVLRAAQTFREYLEQPAQQADFIAAGIKGT
ncbi:hypothetical protein SAMN05421837_1011338 [Amycolatopsis pretoriensis]|uniref:Extracellular solute-binding protein n=1 Tax=Amycolatopsis pretoriensis TaxID=218821 RepID=A0A1H5QAT0_9PSEU|nr:hypothetical protein [Amycolatopsis pretoriensis]SEF22347.1 hypothetical protein SAMN05421837_1011338 [Amycolatopsis pretoriensis]